MQLMQGNITHMFDCRVDPVVNLPISTKKLHCSPDKDDNLHVLICNEVPGNFVFRSWRR